MLYFCRVEQAYEKSTKHTYYLSFPTIVCWHSNQQTLYEREVIQNKPFFTGKRFQHLFQFMPHVFKLFTCVQTRHAGKMLFQQ